MSGDALTLAVLRGVGDGPAPSPGDGPADALVGPVPSPARAVLLRLGARAVVERAALLPPAVSGAAVHPPAHPAPEPLSPAASARLDALLSPSSPDALLFEALALLAARGHSLPPSLLVRALSGPSRWRPAVLSVLGPRGRWLATQNPSWAWAAAPRVPGDPRAELASWPTANVDARTAVLQGLAGAATLHDEPFLDEARRDRAASVRALAVRLLCDVPGTACGERMWARALASLRLDVADAGVSPRTADAPAGAPRFRALLEPPEELDAAAAEDGLVDALGGRSIVGKGRLAPGLRAAWLREVYARVDPQRFEVALGQSPPDILAGVARSPLLPDALTGWILAARRWRRVDWLDALWGRCLGLSAAGGLLFPVDGVAPELPPAVVARRVLQMLELAPGGSLVILTALPAPWPDAVSIRVLTSLRTAAASAVGITFRVPEPHASLLPLAAQRMGPGMFASALEPWRRPAVDGPQVGAWARLLDDFVSTVRTRAAVHEALGAG